MDSEPEEWEKEFEAESAARHEATRLKRFDQKGFDELCEKRAESDASYRDFLKGRKFTRTDCEFLPSREPVFNNELLCEWYFDLDKKYPEPRTPEQCNELRMEVESRLSDYSHEKASLFEEHEKESTPKPVLLLDIELLREPEVYRSNCQMEYTMRKYCTFGRGIWGAALPTLDKERIRILHLSEGTGESNEFVSMVVRYISANSIAKMMKILSFYLYDPKDYAEFEMPENIGIEV